MKKQAIHVIGGGLAGTEAAWQIAQAGVPVILYEMRPQRFSGAHHTEHLAELVCSNSFGALASDRAAGLLHEELRRLNSIVISKADKHMVPAGGALAVDRGQFSQDLTNTLAEHPLIELRRDEINTIPDGIVVLATGPLTSPTLAEDLYSFTGLEYLSFFDAASPIIVGESINKNIAFMASRYDKGQAAYLNCPMNKRQYLHFWEKLRCGEQVELKQFELESAKFFEACLPIEEQARRGEDTMRYGPLKPVGLSNSLSGENYYAIVQLRQEDKAGKLWNMVGFQTNLRWGEQKRIFRLIPGLESAEFVRLGVMHRNTFINAPQLMLPTLQFKHRSDLFAAGQLIGTEGYTAATAGGWLAGTNAARLALGKTLLSSPKTTMMGALLDFISSASPKHFQPMPPNFGILPELSTKIKSKQERYGYYRDRSLTGLENWKSNL
ncbi:tRNA:m(5)U-54 MTase gid [Richelia intracellularis HH01]|uniref:Methylenetetrahydrofolate--tRNA-(uracil-5-)-methyltransferase TrmFO n=1 Tax=Richelia intracellularis HH01 TaxID=1165094 RepID=M1X297_9NOST|nr:FADH(2)-oxidizing methylenetetrahydrofolate--tRNA-(uracil(54)-C(5))-methyltransferase TrmFO [Richelia intracellularis]CCH66445.1 tRNA:m(5)U-54 MTase gid [Richelia intracellularis HH01]HAE06633.1 FADH(2)-oxidizing methylenetetrahydrofolate--tRNA-(uracil(54)-C(5))-methyltransferase TrmFO [Richelia sp.]